MLNSQEYITTKLQEILYEILPITSKRLKNLVNIIIGIILSKSVILSELSEKLNDSYSNGTEESKIKRIYRFLTSKPINPGYVYGCFAEEVLRKYVKRKNQRKVIIIFEYE
ncbi:hypothetical protein [Oceanirhabdus seepicola]|uniref:Uncharacterized protein n=1 Tax=Oceanirhabdus seepicola TaxID=2828781 RepID=A0A9J6P084_9CLOT|nr:hypothetical protein [Oceanirhabdus seepicola]MCM1989277.1 hypothetical protein [Oceanirhabdus seepicola]